MKSSQRGKFNILVADLAGYKKSKCINKKHWHLGISYAGNTVHPSAYK
jgi:hypothetical protein